MAGVMDRAARLAAWSSLTAVGGELDACTLYLFTGATIPDGTQVYADFVQPTFDGYAPVASPAFGSAFVDENGNTVLTGPATDFVASGVTVEDIVTGWFLAKTAGGHLMVYAEKFQDSKVVGSFVGEGFTFTPEVVYGT